MGVCERWGRYRATGEGNACVVGACNGCDGRHQVAVPCERSTDECCRRERRRQGSMASSQTTSSGGARAGARGGMAVATPR